MDNHIEENCSEIANATLHSEVISQQNKNENSPHLGELFQNSNNDSEGPPKMQMSDINPYKKSLTQGDLENHRAFETKNVEFRQLLKPKYEVEESYLMELSDKKQSRTESTRKQSIFKTFMNSDNKNAGGSGSSNNISAFRTSRPSTKFGEKTGQTQDLNRFKTYAPNTSKEGKEANRRTRDETPPTNTKDEDEEHGGSGKTDGSSNISQLKEGELIKGTSSRPGGTKGRVNGKIPQISRETNFADKKAIEDEHSGKRNHLFENSNKESVIVSNHHLYKKNGQLEVKTMPEKETELDTSGKQDGDTSREISPDHIAISKKVI